MLQRFYFIFKVTDYNVIIKIPHFLKKKKVSIKRLKILFIVVKLVHKN